MKRRPFSLPSAPSSMAIPLLLLSWTGITTRPLRAQDNPDLRVARIEIRPEKLEVVVGQRAKVEIVALDSAGKPVEGADLLATSNGAEVSFDPTTNEVRGISPGRTTVSARIRRPTAAGPGFETIRGYAAVTVRPLPVARIELGHVPERLFAGSRSRLLARAHSERRVRRDVAIRWVSSNPEVVAVAAGGLLYAGKPGSARVTARADGVEESVNVRVIPNPIRHITVEPERARVRVGDVLRLHATARDGDGHPVREAEVEWTWTGLSDQPYDAVWLEAEDAATSALVAHDPGLYRITASVGSVWRDVQVEATPRPTRRTVRLIAHGVVPRGQATTDLWVFEGLDGRDYVYTGTFSGNLMYAWDVSDPSRPVITDSVTFDGRRVNDVKINADRTLAVVTSENASTRRNGITVLDISKSAHPKRISHYAEGLTGGVHNTWIADDLVYAIHYGTRDMHIIDISDPTSPREVGRWGLDKEDKFLHDVTVVDGLAYLSYWDDGVVILDVGAGIKGGTPTEPELVSQYSYSYKLGSQMYGNTHHAIRYRNYVFTGDEIFSCSECVNGARGYVHVIDVSDIEHPREVAFYRVPEAGSHNLWAEDDKLYIGYYHGGLRIVDISGELRGDLYRQGREIGWYMTEDSTGTVPNATSTWGAQPYKGKIFAADGSSGLWIVELAGPEGELVP
ncbi:MAG: hypothetical protein ACE5JR_10925 [Gemmatimonadota bacterium]